MRKKRGALTTGRDASRHCEDKDSFFKMIIKCYFDTVTFCMHTNKADSFLYCTCKAAMKKAAYYRGGGRDQREQ